MWRNIGQPPTPIPEEPLPGLARSALGVHDDDAMYRFTSLASAFTFVATACCSTVTTGPVKNAERAETGATEWPEKTQSWRQPLLDALLPPPE